MNAAIYPEKRDQLVTILNKVTTIDGLSPHKKNEFEQIKKKCMEDQYNIVLVGEFQGGKSTTFNTFCDGREISPRGALVKTSACRLTARNLSDQGRQEYAEVQWKTERELFLNIEDILNKHINLKTDLGITFKPGNEIHGLSDVLSFKNASHVVLINNALSEEWKIYESNRGGYHAENLDILRIATLIARYATNAEAVLVKRRQQFSIEEIPRLIVFPEEWETRWKNGYHADFQVNEIFFCLIAGIDCFIHSPNLARLGCSITDCPGLFASKWDTQVALDAIPKADAIIYLLRGDRAIGTEETRALREIQKMPATHEKLFFAINMKVSQHIVDASIIPNDVATIKNLGIQVEGKDIKKYHALMAFLGEFGYAVIQGTMGKSSSTMFTLLAKRMLGIELPVAQAWVMLANQQLASCAVPPDSVAQLDITAVEKVKAFSGSKGLFTAVENHIIANKAYSILVTNGSEKASHALHEIANSLKNREDEANKDVSRRKEELRVAKETLEEFQQDATRIVEDSFGDFVYEILISNFYEEVVLKSVDEVCLKIAYRLEQKLTTAMGFAMLIMGRNQRENLMREFTQPIYNDVMNDVIGNRSKAWMIAVAKNENRIYQASVVAEGHKVKQQLEQRWNKLGGIDFNFSPVEYPNISQMFESLISNSVTEINTGNRLNTFYKVARLKLVDNIFDSIVVFFESAWNQIKAFFDQKVNERPVVADKVPETYEDLNYQAKQLYADVKAAITSSYAANFAAVKQKILEFLQEIGHAAKEQYQHALKNQHERFEADYAVSEQNLNKTSVERLTIAAEAKAIREGQIEPAEAEITTFQQSVTEILKKP